jgi:hypothetical protein
MTGDTPAKPATLENCVHLVLSGWPWDFQYTPTFGGRKREGGVAGVAPLPSWVDSVYIIMMYKCTDGGRAAAVVGGAVEMSMEVQSARVFGRGIRTYDEACVN